MSLLQLSSLLLVLASLFGTINYFYLKLPPAIGILVVALIVSFKIIALDAFFPSLEIGVLLEQELQHVQFSNALLEGMLGLLLFAGALHVKLEALKKEWLAVLLMATIGVALSTVIVGYSFSWLTGMPLLTALVFGALITPTDPVAVLGVLKKANLPKALEAKIAGESLFNDGVGYVVFLVLVGLAFPDPSVQSKGLSGAATLFIQEAAGGAILGLGLGWLAFQAIKHIDDYSLEVLITLGLAFGGYQLAVWLHVSAPIMAVCAGLLIGDVGTKLGMSDQTRDYLNAFWTLVDEILNAILFLMIGFEVFTITFDMDDLSTVLLTLLIALFARFAAVAVPILTLKPFRSFSKGVIPIMTWGGIKGGISVALALSLPEHPYKPLILTTTYVIVIFSIIGQGLTIGALSTRLNTAPKS